ncbi:MAG: hypothetical protein ACXAAK_14265 [Candidatus Thorarchaeota archaeon]
MKRTLQIVLALSLASMFIVQPVAAATSQGLEWGFNATSEFAFTMTSIDFDLEENIFMNITTMPAASIPDPLTDWIGIPDPIIGFYWENGSSLGLWFWPFIAIFAVGSRYTVPIGNFTLIQSLIAPLLTGDSYIDTANTWGIEWTEDDTPTEEFHVIETFSKVDGFLADYTRESRSTINSSVYDSVEVHRINLPSGGFDLGGIVQLLQDNILYVAVGVGVLIILVIVCKKR